MGEQLCGRWQPQAVPAVRVLDLCHLHVFDVASVDQVHLMYRRRPQVPRLQSPPTARALPGGGEHPVRLVHAVHAGRPAVGDQL